MCDPPEMNAKIELKLGVRELRTVTYLTTSEQLSMTIDKGQKLEHLWKIKKSPADTICRLKQRTCLGKPGPLVTLV